MNGVHDMGGMQGLGHIEPEPEGIVFHAAWEGRVHAMSLASPTRSNIDAGRHQRELIPGPEYLRMSYYEKWFRSLSERLLELGLVTAEEFAAGRPAPGAVKGTPRLTADAVESTLSRTGSYIREGTPPQFAPGDTVRARNIHPEGHTRLPRYARGRTGVVERLHGAHVFPDSHAHGLGEDPRPLYTVSFAARELWGEAADPRDSVRLDLWEPYLERA
ncbi:nitrile hydratase subunit beta [Phenylobacterium sp.]|jgi:nitrile hydratase|uniref:nitrile hydratase subunit beta n=1 Tax=Phenylobacterium sp. TaxID=1871053 RepID=UPI002E30B604|nr:nitrile hydratase subunit beta [Phenylobacterium sp.]HEX4710129.1 nitrile hydratase subunit beta [Phenylobacterium sp.]